MSFSSLVKQELVKLPLSSYEKNYAELYGIFKFGKSCCADNCIIVSENIDIVTRVVTILNNPNLHIKKHRNSYLLISKDLKIYRQIIESIKDFFSSSFNHNEFLDYILRGVFLSCGTVTNPNSNYHLEFLLSNKNLSENLISILNSVKITILKPSLTTRKSKYIVYMKDNSQIIDFLTFIGATNSSIEFIQVKMIKEVRNYVNRTTNFETANITKTTAAAADQVKAIKNIIKTRGLNFLSEELKETATLRLNNPYMSLDELAALFKKPITRSGVNYRLCKLLKISYYI